MTNNPEERPLLKLGKGWFSQPQYLIGGSDRPLSQIFPEITQSVSQGRRSLGHLCVQEYVVTGTGRVHIRSAPFPRQESSASYSTEEAIDMWNDRISRIAGGSRSWYGITAGVIWETLTSEGGYGYILGEMASYLHANKRLKVRLLDLYDESSFLFPLDNGRDIVEKRLYAIELKVLPKNPIFTKRKRDIVRSSCK